MNDNSYRCRIGDVYFESRDEAEDWVAGGNIGGTYSIVHQVYCPDHLDWCDEVYDRIADESICAKCYTARQMERSAQQRIVLAEQVQRAADRLKLAAWLAGEPIR